jgi:NADPH-dependent 2,4-dienoyl-CoA reductase/sulfur reductase-like enzyme
VLSGIVGAVARRVVIVGASLAGLRAAETLRTEGFEGSVVLIGAERHLPYDRPPLSKKVLAGEWEPDRIALRKSDEYSSLDFEMRLGERATALDVHARRLTLASGEYVAYDGLVIATGSAPRRLPNQPDLAGVFELRTLDDCLALRAEFDRSPTWVVVVGAGFIGAEVAATARSRGLDVSLVEALPVPLVRGLGPEMGNACAELHRAHGVDLHLGTGVETFEGATRVEAVRLTDGTVVAAEVVVVGVGVAPVTDWLTGSALELRDGVVCDATLNAGAPDVYAAGDVARWPNALYGEEMRVEHWTNAAEQGAAAAHNLLATWAGGTGVAYSPVPFFWSDQYDSRFQFVGRGSGEDEVHVVHGSVAEGRFVALYGRDGQLRGALGLSMPKQLMPYRKLLAAEATLTDALGHAANTQV